MFEYINIWANIIFLFFILLLINCLAHSLSWGHSQKHLRTPCYTGGHQDGFYGPINPILNSTYTFMEKLYREILEVFPETHVHLGGDEVPYECWSVLFLVTPPHLLRSFGLY